MSEAGAFEYDVASALSLGARARQEDAVAVAFPDRANLGFAVLSDGMGGHAAGDLASRAIVAEMFASLTLHEISASTPVPDILCRAVRKANECVKACTDARPACNGMGGTVVATQISGNELHWVSVGDSVLYLFRDATLTRLNADHSMAPQLDLMVANGAMTMAQANAHPQRNCLTSAITGDAIDEVDCPDRPFLLQHNDILILASDGLQFLPDPIIEALLLRARSDSSQDIARDLIDAVDVLNDPEQDNTSVVVIRANAARRHTRKGHIRQTSVGLMKAIRRAVAPTVSLPGRG